MNSRLRYFLISGVILLSILTGIFIWRNKHVNQLPKINEQSFNAPVSSKYIPKNSDLIFHWKINPAILPEYIENYQDKISKHLINKKISFIRDSSFKLLSLDFAKDISKWVGDYGSFAVINSSEEPFKDWIMILAIKKDFHIEKEFESFLSQEINDENNTSNNKLSSSRTEIISKKINSNNSIYFFKDKTNLLIASNPKIIQSSIHKLDNNILNTKQNYKNIQLKDNLKDGLFLLEISPKKILNLIGQKENLFEINNIDNFISSFNLDKNKLNFEGIISYNSKIKMPENNFDQNLVDITKGYSMQEDYILVDNPKQYFRKNFDHPYQKFIASLIQESTSFDHYNLFKVVLENSKGNLILINEKDWLILTKKSNTNKKEIIDTLKKEKFLNSNLDIRNKNLEIWSKISTDENKEYELKENIAAIIQEDEENYIWSQNLSSILNFENENYLNKFSANVENKYELNDFDNILRIHLEQEKTKIMLNNFYPYILFNAMLGNKLNPPQNLDIYIAVPKINYPDFIKVKINLKTS